MAVKQNDPVLVEWVDSMSTQGWRDLGGTDIKCQTVGMFVQEDREKVAVCLNKSAYGYGDYIEIPKVAIKRIRKLKLK